MGKVRGRGSAEITATTRDRHLIVQLHRGDCDQQPHDTYDRQCNKEALYPVHGDPSKREQSTIRRVASVLRVLVGGGL